MLRQRTGLQLLLVLSFLVFWIPPSATAEEPDAVAVAEYDDWQPSRIFVKAGYLGRLGSGFLEDRTIGGWTVQLGRREWFSPVSSGENCFFELGGGYSQSFGDKTRILTSGSFQSTVSPVEAVAEAFKTRLNRLDRMYAQFAVGKYFGPVYLKNTPLLLTGRVGGRGGHVRADFTSDPTSTLKQLIADDTAFGGIEVQSHVNSTDVMWGLFGNAGVGLAYPDAQWGFWRFGDVSIEGEIELSHDWFDLGAFGSDSHGFGTIAAMLNITFLR